eukprot:scaffold50218_cov68-Phaeocystis_antarctica.AAC.1
MARLERRGPATILIRLRAPRLRAGGLHGCLVARLRRRRIAHPLRIGRGRGPGRGPGSGREPGARRRGGAQRRGRCGPHLFFLHCTSLHATTGRRRLASHHVV